MKIYNKKFKSAILITIVLFLIFAKNIWEKKNVIELGSSFSTFYEDRLLAESYIYDLSYHLYQKKLLLNDCDFVEDEGKLLSILQSHNAAINALILDFEKTKLTNVESYVFSHLKANIQDHIGFEEEYSKSMSLGKINPLTQKKMDHSFYIVLNDLNHLSRIQISEGKILNDHSNYLVAGSTLLTQFEMVLLIIIGLLILIITVPIKYYIPKVPQNHHLN